MKRKVFNFLALSGVIKLNDVDISDILAESGMDITETDIKGEGTEQEEIVEEVVEEKKTVADNIVADEIEVEKPDYSEYIKSTFGEDYTEDEIKTVLSKRDRIMSDEQLEEISNLKRVRSEYDKLKDEVGVLKNTKHFEDDDLFRLNKILKEKGEDEYKILSKVKYGGLSPMELVKLNHIKNNPELAKDEQKLERFIKSKYNTQFLQEKDEDGETVSANVEENQRRKDALEYQLEIDSLQAKKDLLKDFNSIEIPDFKSKEDLDNKQKEDFEQSGKELVEKWKGDNFSKISNSFKSVQLDIADVEGDMTFEMSKDQMKEYSKLAANIIVDNRFEVTTENINYVKEVVQNKFILDNINNLMKEAFIKGSKATEEDVQKTIGNSSEQKNDDLKSEGKKTMREASYDEALNDAENY